jgi:membrane-associated phospholipid phosphatase
VFFIRRRKTLARWSDFPIMPDPSLRQAEPIPPTPATATLSLSPASSPSWFVRSLAGLGPDVVLLVAFLLTLGVLVRAYGASFKWFEGPIVISAGIIVGLVAASTVRYLPAVYARRFGSGVFPRRPRLYFWICLPLVISLWLSTIYLRHHWIPDILAGLVLGFVANLIAPWLRRHWQRLPQTSRAGRGL